MLAVEQGDDFREQLRFGLGPGVRRGVVDDLERLVGLRFALVNDVVVLLAQAVILEQPLVAGGLELGVDGGGDLREVLDAGIHPGVEVAPVVGLGEVVELGLAGFVFAQVVADALDRAEAGFRALQTLAGVGKQAVQTGLDRRFAASDSLPLDNHAGGQVAVGFLV